MSQTGPTSVYRKNLLKLPPAPAAAGPQLLRLRMLWGFSGSRVITAPGMGNFGTSALLLGNTDVWRN